MGGGFSWIGARKATAPRPQWAAEAADTRYSAGGLINATAATMAHKLWQLRVVPKPQREHVAVATEDDGFPPAVAKAFLSDDEMPRRDVVPGPG